MTFRDKIYAFLTHRLVMMAAIVAFTVFTFFADDLVFFISIFWVLIVLWASRWDWHFLNFRRPRSWPKLLWNVVVLSVLTYLLADVIIQPIVEISTDHVVDLSSFDHLRGSWINYFIMILIMWVIAGFGEEFVYRGFLIKQTAILLGNDNKAWLIGLLLSSFLFGYGHLYQGLSGMISTGLIGFLMGLVFWKNKDGLITCILYHGFYDIIGITLVFTSKERVAIDWFKDLLLRTFF